MRREEILMSRESVPTTDNEIISRVSNALAADERTAKVPIEVIAQRGLVTLEGEVANREIRRLAEEIAAGQPGVIKVINDLAIVPDEKGVGELVKVAGLGYTASGPTLIPEEEPKED
jgi:hypothetical protein